MTTRSSAATAHLVAKLLAVLPMPAAAVPDFMLKIDDAIRGLSLETSLKLTKTPTATPSAAFIPEVKRPSAVVSRPAMTASRMGPDALEIWAKTPIAEVSSASHPLVEVIPPRRRGRPPGSGRKIALIEAAVEADIEDEMLAPVQSRLLRRADVTDDTQDLVPPVLQVLSDGPMRGVVKWFDGRSGKGALRLVGIGDVALEQRVLDQSHIKRLYRDQEVEAQVEQNGSKVRLLSLSIPGRLETPSFQSLGSDGEVTHMVKRQPRTVVVEIKRDTSKRRRVRADADHAFGSDALVLPGR